MKEPTLELEILHRWKPAAGPGPLAEVSSGSPVRTP